MHHTDIPVKNTFCDSKSVITELDDCSQANRAENLHNIEQPKSLSYSDLGIVLKKLIY